MTESTWRTAASPRPPLRHTTEPSVEVGDPANSYGQSIRGATQSYNFVASLDFVDLIDMDVQGAELEILVSATGRLAQDSGRLLSDGVPAESQPTNALNLCTTHILGSLRDLIHLIVKKDPTRLVRVVD
jgi:hypothetical protein